MSLVKELVEQHEIAKCQIFLDMVMLIGGLQDLRKRQKENKLALKYLDYKQSKDNYKRKVLKMESEHIKNGVKNQIKKIEKKYYEFLRLCNCSKLSAFICSKQGVDMRLNESETTRIKKHIEENYGERKPFPYPHLISIFFDETYRLLTDV